MPSDRSSPHRIVIIGAGFAGLECTQRLSGAPVSVTLLDRNNYHLFTPLVYQVASSLLDPSEIAFPVRASLRRQKNARFRLADVASIDFEARVVRATDGAAYEYDSLVVAAGSASFFFGMQDVERGALGLKTLPEALELRNHILRCFESAVKEPNEAAQRKWLTFVIVGAGPTGVEFAGALSELVRRVLVRDFPELDMKTVRIVLLEGQNQPLPAFPPDLSQKALESLRNRRIELMLNTRLTRVGEDSVELSSGERIMTKSLVWAAGVGPAKLAEVFERRTPKSRRVESDGHLRAAGREDVFVVGDLAAVTQDGAELPMLAPVAQQEGAYVASAIAARARGAALPAPFRYRDKGIMATIGRNSAVAYLFNKVKISGFAGWLTWLSLHLFWLIGFRNRLSVLIGWGYEYIHYDRPVRMIARAKHRKVDAGDSPVSADAEGGGS